MLLLLTFSYKYFAIFIENLVFLSFLKKVTQFLILQ